MNRFLSPLFNLLLVVILGFGLGGCVTTRLPMASESPWEGVDLQTDSNPLDISFVDANHGFLIGTNRLIRETEDGGVIWKERKLDLRYLMLNISKQRRIRRVNNQRGLQTYFGSLIVEEKPKRLRNVRLKYLLLL